METGLPNFMPIKNHKKTRHSHYVYGTDDVSWRVMIHHKEVSGVHIKPVDDLSDKKDSGIVSFNDIKWTGGGREKRIAFIFYASSSFSFKESWLNETATQLQDTHVNVPSLEIEILWLTWVYSVMWSHTLKKILHNSRWIFFKKKIWKLLSKISLAIDLWVLWLTD